MTDTFKIVCKRCGSEDVSVDSCMLHIRCNKCKIVEEL
jgi:hypothetical protein